MILIALSALRNPHGRALGGGGCGGSGVNKSRQQSLQAAHRQLVAGSRRSQLIRKLHASDQR